MSTYDDSIELNQLDRAIQNCTKLESELDSIVRDLKRLNLRHNPDWYFHTHTMKSDDLNELEDDLLNDMRVLMNSFDSSLSDEFDLNSTTASYSVTNMNNSRTTSCANLSTCTVTASATAATTVFDRTLNDINQIYSELNTKMIKLKRSCETPMNCIQVVKTRLNFQNYNGPVPTKSNEMAGFGRFSGSNTSLKSARCPNRPKSIHTITKFTKTARSSCNN